jgi:hypothetical protein
VSAVLLCALAAAWHQEYEGVEDYAESWFFLAMTADQGLLMASLSITNLGPGTFNGVATFQYYGPGGVRHVFHREVSREDVRAQGQGLDLTVGPGRVTRSSQALRLAVRDGDVDLELRLDHFVPPRLEVGEGPWRMELDVPRAQSTGTLAIGAQRYSLRGEGYHDHTWSLEKLPELMERWFTLRVLGPDQTVVLHQQKGEGLRQFGLCGDAASLHPLQDFRYTPTSWRQEPTSGRKFPTAFAVQIDQPGCQVTGTVRETRFLDAIDVLEHLSWPVRVLVKMAYTPTMIRYFGRYDLAVTRAEATTTLSGIGLVETNYLQ